MSRLLLHLLGPFQATLDGQPLTEFRSDKVRALLAYLALEADRPHRRDALAGLLWPEVPDSTARNNLRVSLHRLRQTIGETAEQPRFLQITSETIQFNSDSDIWLDVFAFDTLLAAVERHAHRRVEACPECTTKLREAAELYRGDFLQGFFLDDCVAFSEWVVIRREGSHRRVLEALYGLAEYHRLHGEADRALVYARRQLALEPWREEAHRQVMQALALSGERSAALAQYERCRTVLASELAAEPSTETTELYEWLRNASAGPLDVPAEGIIQGHRIDHIVLPCPYRGLFAFREPDAPFFFGRETFIARLVKAVRRNNLITVLGASGSGKSSVVFAGLLPQMRNETASLQARQSESPWVIVDFRPGSRPFHALASALLSQLETHTSETEQLVEIRKLADALSQGNLNLHDVAERVLQKGPDAGRLLLVIDQLEELYTLCSELEIRRRFLDMVLEAVVPAGQLALTVVLTLRADFMGQALAYRRFADALQASVLILGPMTHEELKQAIENPAHKRSLTFESGLVERILHDVGDEPGHLPLLEFALTSLWDWQEEGRLTHAAYEAIGQVEGALARYAEDVYTELSESERERSQQVFVQLVRPGEGTEDTRRLATRVELGEPGWALAQRLADARLVVADRDLAGQETVEVAHEALIRHWGRWREWMEADRTFRAWQERLRAGLRQWEENGRDEGALLRGAPLAEAESWLSQRSADLSEAEQEFIQMSSRLREQEATEREAQRQRELEAAHRLTESEAQRAKEQAQAARQLRRRALLLTGALLIASLLAVAALAFGQQATRNAQTAQTAGTLAAEQRDEAQRQARLALSRQLAAQALSRLERQFDLALLLSLEAYRLETSFETRSNLVASLQHEPRLTTFLHNHQGSVVSVAFSPDGKTIASGSDDKTIILWDVSNPESSVQLGPPLTGHTNQVSTVAFSPDGDMLASSGGDGTIRLWDVSNPVSPAQLGSPLTGHTDWVNTVAFSPDSQTLASGSDDKTVILWDVSNPQSPVQLASPLIGHTDLVWRVAFSPDGRLLASGSGDKTIRLWDVSNPESPIQLGPPLIGHNGPVRHVAFSPDSTRSVLASGSGDGTILLWDVSNPKSPLRFDRPLSGHASWVTSMAFSPDGKTLASGSTDNTIILWNVSDPQLRIRLGSPLPGHSDWVWNVAFSPDGKTLASGGSDNTIILWDVSNPQLPAQLGEPLTGHQDLVWGVAFSPDGKTLASGSADNTVILWDIQTHQPIGPPLTGHTDQVNQVAFSPDGTILASGSDDTTIRLWDVSNPASPVQLGSPLTGHSDVVSSVAFHPDDTRSVIVSGSRDKTIRLWDVSNPALPVQLGSPLAGHSEWVVYVAFSPDGKRLASTSEDNTFILWDISDPKSPGWLSQSLAGQQGFSVSMAFSPDGKTLALGDAGGDIVLWDISEPKSPVPLTRLTGHTRTITSLAFGPDGKVLASSAVDTIILWHIDFASWQALTCRIANRNLTLKEWEQYFGDEPYRKTCSHLP